MLTIHAMTGGNGYAQRHLQQSDYYDQQRTIEGQWRGRGAELLGLSGSVSSEDFEALRQGLARSGNWPISPAAPTLRSYFRRWNRAKQGAVSL